jgi:hypothetical protein
MRGSRAAAQEPVTTPAPQSANAATVTLIEAGVHAHIRAMDRHQGDAEVQETACGALWSLATNDANRVPLMGAEAAKLEQDSQQHHVDALPPATPAPIYRGA